MFLSGILIFSFLLNLVGPLPQARADPAFGGTDEFRLPAPGVMVRLSPPLDPPILKGIKVHPDNPFQFDFILDQGDSNSVIPAKAGIQNQEQLKTEATRLIKYFLASLTIPEKDLWVNLSPYEKDRIIPQSFGLTEMGRDLLAEDYMLKQITASLIYPEDTIGKKFWKRIYEEASKKFGTTNIPVNTFNKVWIVPEKAVVYENAKAGTAYVVEAKLKVMLEQDYLSLSRHSERSEESHSKNDINALGSQIIREIVIPELTKEVNEDKNFAQLRQVYNSLILATWYKKKIKDSILEQVYADKNKTAGVQYTSTVIPSSSTVIPSSSTVIPAKAGIHFKNDVEGLYQEYLKAFKKGVYNYIKEEIDPVTQETIPRKYFSGGFNMAMTTGRILATTHDASMLSRREFIERTLLVIGAGLAVPGALGQAISGSPESTPVLAGNVDLNKIENVDLNERGHFPKNSFSRTGIYRIGPEVPGKLSVLFIHGAWGAPENFIEHIKELKLKGEANIFVFKYDFKEALENAGTLRSWLGTWAEYLRQNGSQGGIIVAHSFGNNVLIKAVEDMQPVENNYTMLQTFLQHSTVIQIAPTLNGSKVVNEFSKPVVEELGDALGFRKLRHAQTPGGEAIKAIQDGYGNFLDNIGHVFAIFASEDKHIGNRQEAEQMMNKLLGDREKEGKKVPTIEYSQIPGHYEVLNSQEAEHKLFEVLADRAMVGQTTGDRAMNSIRDLVWESQDIIRNMHTADVQGVANELKNLKRVYKELKAKEDDVNIHDKFLLTRLADFIKHVEGQNRIEIAAQESAAKHERIFLEMNDSLFPGLTDEQIIQKNIVGHLTDFQTLYDIIFKSNGKILPEKSPQGAIFFDDHEGQTGRTRETQSYSYKAGVVRLVFDYKTLTENTGIKVDGSYGELSSKDEIPLTLLCPESKKHVWDTIQNYMEAIGEEFNDEAKQKVMKALGYSDADLGGIDFTANKTPLEIQNAGEGIEFHLDPAMLRQLQNAPGFVPVIISIQPLNNLREFLGIDATV
jgi:hypothetical protein